MPGLVRAHPDPRAVTRCRSPRLARVGGWSDLAWLIPSAGSDRLILATCSLSTSVLVCAYRLQRRDQIMCQSVLATTQTATPLVKLQTQSTARPVGWFEHLANGDETELDVDQPYQATVKTLDEERVIFDLINFGGVPQGETD